MNQIIENKKTEITKLCKEYGVKELYAFGSVVRDDFKFYSDVDLLVEFKDDEQNSLFSKSYFWLREEFAYLFKRPVDLILNKGLRESFKEFIDSEKKLIYG